MYHPSDILSIKRTSNHVVVETKKRALEVIASLFTTTDPTLDKKAIFNRLIERERLGATGLGQGIAIPHARIPGLTEITGALIHLEHGVNFDADDGAPVDLLFALLIPENAGQAHLELLASLAEMFRKPDFCARLRGAQESEELYRIIREYEQQGWAA